jgi:hypothetical protein
MLSVFVRKSTADSFPISMNSSTSQQQPQFQSLQWDGIYTRESEKVKGILVYTTSDAGSSKKDGRDKRLHLIGFLWSYDNIMIRMTWLLHGQTAVTKKNDVWRSESVNTN